MKAISGTLAAVAAALIIAAVPVLGSEGATDRQGQNAGKDECLLVAMNCPTDSVQARIQRIQNEIRRGSDVYTPDEMRRLNDELEQAQKLLEFEMTNGGA